MERLTEKVLGFIQLKACGNDFCKETCAEYDEEKGCNNCPIQKAFEKLAEDEDLEEQGKLLKLPCAVGDTVYRINKWGKEPIIPMKVCEVGAISLKVGGFVIQIMCRDELDNGEAYYLNTDFGKTVFLTQSEAEQALAETENNSIDEIREMVKDCCCELRVLEDFEEDKNNGQAD